MNPIVLIVDDEKPTRDGLRQALDERFEVYVAADAREARQVLKSEPVDILLTDLRLGTDSGMDLLDEALTLTKPPVSIMMTAYGSVETAVEAMRRGAWRSSCSGPRGVPALAGTVRRGGGLSSRLT